MNAGVGVVRVGVVRVIINLHRMFEGTIWDTFQGVMSKFAIKGLVVPLISF